MEQGEAGEQRNAATFLAIFGPVLDGDALVEDAGGAMFALSDLPSLAHGLFVGDPAGVVASAQKHGHAENQDVDAAIDGSGDRITR
jgi:hypothetical protein